MNQVPNSIAFGSTTTWQNPMSTPAKFEVCLDHGRFQKVEIPAGGEMTLPSDWDRAVQEVDKNGVVVGGKAPQLIRKGGEALPVHSSILESAKPTMSKDDALKAERLRAERAEAELAELKASLEKSSAPAKK